MIVKIVNSVFADTSGWANFFLQTEPYHKNAKSLMLNWYANNTLVITTNYVLLELVALFTSPLRISRNKQVEIIETIKSADWVRIVHVDVTIDNKAWTLLKNRQDKTWSLVDCTSFIVMNHNNIIEALTTDHHFEQNGFLKLLK